MTIAVDMGRKATKNKQKNTQNYDDFKTEIVDRSSPECFDTWLQLYLDIICIKPPGQLQYCDVLEKSM